MDRKKLEHYINLNFSRKQIAQAEDIAPSTVGHWLNKYGLKTQIAVSNKGNFPDVTKEVLAAAIKESNSKMEVLRVLNWPCNTSGYRWLKYWEQQHGLQAPLGDSIAKGQKPWVERSCVVCNKIFKVRSESDIQEVCGTACGNVLYRSGPSNGQWKDATYRTTCFFYHEKKCVVCGEENIVTVHHYDENNSNNAPENLIPLCPTHHQYWHSKFQYLIREKVDVYKEAFIAKNGIDQPQKIVPKGLGCNQAECIPDWEELASMLDKYPYTKVGHHYGVSDNAVRKWVRAAGYDPKEVGKNAAWRKRT